MARPIFFVGMPRSGTTLMFEAFAARGDVAWISQHVARWPRWTSLALLSRVADISPALRRSVQRSGEPRSPLTHVRIGPSEGYAFWERLCGSDFRYDFMLGREAPPTEAAEVRAAIARVQRWHGKPRFAAKLTGPARIGYLDSVFEAPVFVHLVRDGRAVVSSLLEVDFWDRRERRTQPAWRNGLTAQDEAAVAECAYPELALAAVQWRRVVESARSEARSLSPGRYIEIRYEDFLGDPIGQLRRVEQLAGLEARREPAEFLRRRVTIKNMNRKWNKRFDAGQIAALNDLLRPTLDESGYQV